MIQKFYVTKTTKNYESNLDLPPDIIIDEDEQINEP